MSVRKVVEEDRKEIEKQILLEPYHKDAGFSPDQFYEPDTVAMCFSDEEGDVAYMVIRKVAHCHIQWIRHEGEEIEHFKERIRKRLTEEMPGVMGILASSGYKACIYDTTNPSLAWFLRRFGFKNLKDTFVTWLRRQ